MTNVEQNIQSVQKMYQAFGQGDVPAVLAQVDPDAYWIYLYGQGYFPGQWGKPCRGHSEIAGFFQAIGETVEVQGFEPIKFIAQDDQVVVLINWKGVVRKTGKPFATMLTHIWTFQAGKAVHVFALDDPLAYSF